MIRIELTAAIDAAGTLQTFYLSDTDLATTPTDTPANQAFVPRLIDAGRLGVNAFSDGRTGGGTKLETGEIVIANADGVLDDWINYSFDGRPVKIRSGEPGAAYPAGFALILSGTVESIDASFETIIVRLRDKQFILDKPVLSNQYAGNNALPNGLEGLATDLKGRRKPRAYGKVFNVAPPLVNTLRLIYEVGVAATVDAVYDRGLVLTAGAAYASQADMEANAPAAGQYRAWAAGGYIRLGSNPAGLITADLTQGATAAARTAGQILQQLALSAGLTAGEVSAADVTALDALNSAVVGIWLDGETTFREAMDQVAASIGAYYAFDSTGLLRMGRLSTPAGAPVATLELYDYKRDVQRQAPRDNGVPIWRATVRHSRIWNVQGSDLAGGVAADRRAYLAEEARAEKTEDAAIKTQWTLAGEAEFETLLTSAADAQAEAARLLALYKVRRDIFEVPVPISYLSANPLRIMDLVQMKMPRFGMAAGRLFRVLGIRIELGNKQALLTLWG
ncbi:hypothetical protein ACFQUU_08800 [Herbaspirillum sp. GCM10030257]|uniref:hypothetical protein n=1 Tax=Herbaspirillum sp. GCM10030257 TaxID=3273393 RepID=UPI00361B6205